MSQSHRQYVCRALFPNGLPPIYECPLEHGMASDIEDGQPAGPEVFDYTLQDILDGFAALSDLFVQCASKNEILIKTLQGARKDSSATGQDPASAVYENLDGALDGLGNYELASSQSKNVASVKYANGALSRCNDLRREGKTVHGDLRVVEAHTESWKSATARPSMERDFTTARQRGQLGCPFADSARSADPTAIPLHNLPTPRSSRSFVDDGQRQPKRTSFDRSSRGGTGKSPAASATGSGPGCPIRYMDQHSPEEIAKYFEDHKHELPRSHELCVKRFQDNSASIRELDAKYGNLVSMIQGLGQKHQPMLPDNPDNERADPREEEAEEEKKNTKRVEKWAKAVSESAADAEEPEGCLDTTKAQQVSEEEEQRESRFDRPLKDIRLGESPSRPWGVSIPSKYLDRFSSHGSRHSSQDSTKHHGDDKQEQLLADEADRGQTANAPYFTVEAATVPPTKAEPDPSALEKPISRGRSRAKCPFDHAALKARQAQGEADAPSKTKAILLRQKETRQPDSDIAPSPAEEDDADDKIQRSRKYKTPKSKSSRTSSKAEQGRMLRPRKRIINQGLLIVAGSQQLEKDVEVTNQGGTMILGYAAANIPKILASEYFQASTSSEA
ncbi:MAG: hypothetical protein M1828_003127 [Chrysothrix sp. TS-e1954]|nr:MAG: hypothetical protein M1828_003127 [Chrysothrix sp. TS-e1954]